MGCRRGRGARSSLALSTRGIPIPPSLAGLAQRQAALSWSPQEDIAGMSPSVRDLALLIRCRVQREWKGALGASCHATIRVSDRSTLLLWLAAEMRERYAKQGSSGGR